jgi:hypothetical protein
MAGETSDSEYLCRPEMAVFTAETRTCGSHPLRP